MSDRDLSKKTANEQLMSCPFCGGNARISEHVVPVTRFLDFGRRRITSEFKYGITCQKCGATGSQYFETMGEAVNAWNTRVPVPQEISAREYEKAIKTIVASHDLSTLKAWQSACEDKDWEKAVEIIEEWAKAHLDDEHLSAMLNQIPSSASTD